MKKGYSKEAGSKPLKGRVKKGYDLAEPEEMPATIYLSDKDLPELKRWDVGKSYKVIVEMEQTGKNINEHGSTKRTNGTFEVKSIKVA